MNTAFRVVKLSEQMKQLLVCFQGVPIEQGAKQNEPNCHGLKVPRLLAAFLVGVAENAE